MAWRKLSGSTFLKPAEFDVGDVMVLGAYVGSRPTQYGEAYDWRNEDGGTVSIHGYPPIVSQMENVEPGTMCRVTYEGQVKSKNSYNYHNFSVEISDGGIMEDVEDETVVATPTQRTAKAAPAPLTKGKAPVATTTADDDGIEELEDDLEDDMEVEEVVKPVKRALTTPRKKTL
jgi:hypothetical protein